MCGSRPSMERWLANFIVSSYLVLTFVTKCTSNVVTWSPDKSFNVANNFVDGITPCSKRSVVFPESVQESIQIDSSILVSEMILPMDGILVLAEGQSLYFGEDPDDVNCTSGGYSFYKDDSTFTWTDPGVWNSSRFNKATPDTERIPCYDDFVVFPTHSQFTVMLPEFSQYVSGLTIDNRNLTTPLFLEKIFRQADGVQQFVPVQLNDYPVVVQPAACKSTAGCPCQVNGLRINCNLKYCAPPKCSDPIKAAGHCCEICGGALLFDLDNFSMRAFKKFVKEVIDSYGADDFVYHIGMLPSIDLDTMKAMPKRVQVIVMDKGEYSGVSSEIVNEISYQLSQEWTKNEKLLQMSGSPESKSGLGSKIAASMFFAVVIAIGIVFAYYYRGSQFKLPDFRSIDIRSGVLSRFQRRSDSVVSLTRRDSALSGLRESVGGTAFRNPLYDSKRGRVIVAESILEE